MGKVWFEGTEKIDCDIQKLKQSMEDHGKFYTDVVTLMPGLSSVELVDSGSDFVTIKTNEGEMRRSNISKKTEADSVIIEFDEEYQAGSMVTASSHFYDEFKASESGITHRMVISGVKAPGVLGFFYKSFGSSSIGNAVQKTYKTYLESTESN